ncbi:alanyl-tRNA editing protein AlaX [Candidatus Woesearchaeota archaeon CG_4_10_14_0_8_um_filter_47_5]|nr:MAG: alanyl-tRNA editing protein AlaX [Candidatus Woesearchaeota archaeon CG_4_10_14_0_8_um_filter_47_5]
MAGKALYMDDSYLKEFDATVVKASGKYVVLDQTAFYPNSGGQPHDTGVMITPDGKMFKVVYVGKFEEDISHEVDSEGLKAGDRVHGVLDWERRYRLMRMHTAAHVVDGVFNNEAGALITGGQLDVDKSRIDFDLEAFDREKLAEYIAKANALIDQDLPVVVSYMKSEDARKDPTLFKLAAGFKHEIETIRIVDIKGFDRQADGGTHVKSLKEVGHVELAKCENKGKTRRRIYYTLSG